MNRPRTPGRGLTLLLIVMLLAAAAATFWAAFGTAHLAPIHISVNGEEVITGLDLASMSPGDKALAVGAAMIALMAALVIVPIALMTALIGILIAVLAVLGLPLLAVATVVGLLLSPLVLLVWLIWRLLRPSPSSTTMAG